MGEFTCRRDSVWSWHGPEWRLRQRTLYKAGIGHMNSLVALLGIPIGIALIEYGPLSGLSAYLKTLSFGRITLSSITGLPFWSLALILAGGTLAVSLWKRNKAEQQKAEFQAATDMLNARSWKPWLAGLLIGVLGGAAYLSSAASGRNYPLGVTHGVVHAQLVVTDQNLNFVYKPAPPPPTRRRARHIGSSKEKCIVVADRSYFEPDCGFVGVGPAFGDGAFDRKTL